MTSIGWSIPENQGGPYDACIEISDFGEFSNKLSEALKQQDNKICRQLKEYCIYESNKGVIKDKTTKLPNYFRKPGEVSFNQQKEFR